MNLRRIADPDPWSSDKGNQISSDNQCNGRTRSGITSAIEPRWLDLGSDLDETYNSIKSLGMVQGSTKAGQCSLQNPALASSGRQATSSKRQASSLTGTV